MLVFYSKHALEKMDGLGIERKEIENTIIKGMKWREIDNEKWHAALAGIECVFIKKQNAFFIITVYMGGDKK